jgi:hypothetical protein
MAFSTLSSVNSLIKYSSGSGSSIPTANMLYYYKFISADITSGVNVKNYATGSYDGLLNTSNAYSTNSKFGITGRGSLNSNNGYMNSSTFDNFTNSGLTMSIWIYAASGGDIFSFTDTGNDTANAFMFEFHLTSPYITGAYFYVYNNSSLNITYPANTYSINTWYHYCLVLGSGSAKLYINGTQVYTTSYTFNGITWDSSRKFYIGAGGGGVNSGNFYVDEFRIYNCTITPSQVTALYNYNGN